jgi:very-short-patch-repair endonuclease
MGAAAIDYAVKTGRLVVVHHGVYAVQYRRREPIALAAAAVLACGDGAVLSHASAAALWGMVTKWPPTPEVTVPGDRRRPNITVHRSTTLTRALVRRHRGVPVTSAARTALDLKPSLTTPQLIRAIDEARLNGFLHTSQLAPSLRALIDDQAPTRNVFEAAFRKLCASHGLPRPAVNVKLAGYEVDALFARERVIVELDGYKFHSGHRPFERDRERDVVLLELGYVTIRITWVRIRDQSDREAARLRAILEQRRALAA